MPHRTHDGHALILLVEDNLGDVVLVQEAFEGAGADCRFDVVSDGEAALAHLRHASGRPAVLPDLILLDLNLPRQNGHEVLQALKADLQLRRIPVLVLSSSQDPKDIERSYDLHASAYICKPVDIGEFMELARMIERFWLTSALMCRCPSFA